ncbi:GNAT family N-acetyltransferase [Micromonospora sp. CPCC 206061]|uniref:GNAT family N-acetyltransferase n=1 Tax=Micromonospora sp. CPCC 206061 TaxID=3122410 RepID=UPI003FA55FC5
MRLRCAGLAFPGPCSGQPSLSRHRGWHALDLLGFAYLIPGRGGWILLDNLHVDPAHTGGGIGRRLLRHAFTWAAITHPDQPVYLSGISTMGV